MREDDEAVRKQHFADNWLAWAALHHFLPASLLRELSYVIVEQMSKGALSFGHLFDEVITDGPSSFGLWLIRPLETHSQLAAFLQHRIRALVWQNDAISIIDEKIEVPPDAISTHVLDKAIVLGFADFTSVGSLLRDIELPGQPSFATLISTVKLAQESVVSLDKDEFSTNLEQLVKPIEKPLSAAILKHIGDLCADVDAWDKSQVLYELVIRKVSSEIPSAWADLSSMLHTIIKQSIASAMSTISGARPAAELLVSALNQVKVRDNPLLYGNASYDAFVASMHDVDFTNLPPDRRAAVLFPPLLHDTHRLSAALRSWSAADFNNAHRLFWAVLRRQVALGSATESRITKAFYARSLFNELDETIASQSRPQDFGMAIRLLLESGNSKAVTEIRWNEQVVDTYVDQECVDFVINHARVHVGSRLERQLVVIELFRAWAEKISIDRVNVATSMLRHISSLSLEPSSIMEDRNIGGQSLEALQDIARKRPELRYGIVSDVADVLSKRIGAPRDWRNNEMALETALEYIDVFPANSLQIVLNSTLSLLDNINPKAGRWPIVRPALTLLTTKAIRTFARQTPELEKRIISTILRFGMEQESEHANVLFYIHDFDPMLLRDATIRDTLNDTVNHVRQSAIKINTSNAVVQIQALLLAPAVAGLDGVKDALHGLTLILRSVKGDHRSIAFPTAYDALLLLAERQEQIASDISVDIDTFRSWLKPLVGLVIDLWAEAKERPLVFATFSFPPATKPDPITVHNWAFASIQFAKTLKQDEQIQLAIKAAEVQPVLRNAIALARATRSAAGEDEMLDVDAIRNENRDAFYSALGRRLVVLQNLDGEQGRELCRSLLDQCLRLGPRGIDAAVFLSAIGRDQSGYITRARYSDYMKRLENSRDLRLALAPIFDMLLDKGKTGQ